MKYNTLYHLLLSATLFLVTTLDAQPLNTPVQGNVSLLDKPTQPTLSEQDKELIKRFDKNGDGVLDEEELAVAHESMYRNQAQAEIMARRIYDIMLSKFDTRHEGKLDLTQQDLALEYLKNEHPDAYKKSLTRFGHQGSERLTSGEKNAFFQYLGNLPSTLSKKEIKQEARLDYSKTNTSTVNKDSGVTHKPAQKLYVALLKNFDLENKGSLTPDQQLVAIEYIQSNRPLVYSMLLKKYDANSNDKLDKEEILKLFNDLEKTMPPKIENDKKM